jgi:hypothetical protein
MKSWIRSEGWRCLFAAGLVWLSTMQPASGEEFRFTQAAGLAVPDGGGLGVFLQQTVPNLPGQISSVRVALDIDGGWNGDLYAFLTVGDQMAVLLNRPGRESGSLAGYGDAGMRVLLDDAAAGGDIHRYRAGVAGPPTFAEDGALTGVWAPDGRDTDPDLALGSDARTALLSEFVGRSPAGVWTLFVADLESGGVHVLRGWELFIEVQTESVNRAPSFVGLTNATISELVSYTRELRATDPDVPVQSLGFRLVSAPTGAGVSNGVFTWMPGENQGPSTNEVLVSVSDGVVTVTNSFAITVRELNALPILSGATNATINELLGYTQNLVPADVDIPAQSLTVDLLAGPTGLVVTNGVLAWTPTEAQGPSTNTVQVSVTDGVATVTNSFSVVLLEVNTQPTLGGATNSTISELVGYTQNLAPADLDIPVQPLTVTLVSGPAGLVVTNGVLAWTPTEAQGPSTNTVQVSVTDGVVTVTRTFTVSVSEVNQPPVLAAVADQSLSEGQTFGLNLVATDVDLPVQPLTFALVSGPAGLTVTPAGALSWIPTEAQAPTSGTVTVSVTDGLATVTRTFSVTALEVNQAPMLAAVADQNLSEGQTIGLNLVATDVDLPVQPLTFALVSGPAGLTVSPAGAVSWTPTEAQAPTTNTVQVSVTDGVATVMRTFTVSVSEVNQPPVLAAVADQSLSEGQTIGLNLVATDVDLPLQTLTFALVSGPAGLTVSPAGALSWTPTEAQAPTMNTVQVSVTDGVATVMRTFSVTALEVNQPPVLAAVADQRLSVGQTLSLNLVATDVDLPLQTLTFALVSGPAGLTVSPAGALSWTTTEAQAPTSGMVTVSVTDGVATVMRTFTVSVSEVNQPPVIDPFPRLTVVESGMLQEQLVARDGDLPLQTLVFRLLQAPTGVSLTTGGLLQWALRRTDIPGNYPIEVEVSDGVANARRAGVITVTPSGIDPLVLPVADTNAVENTVSRALLTSPDPDMGAPLRWSLVQGPQGFAMAADGRWSWQPGESLGGTRWTIVAEATDGRIRSRVSFRMDVVEDNQSPIWLTLPPPVLTEGLESVWMVRARDSDEPVQALAYRLVSGPTGLTVNASGEVRWTPTEAQGPSESALEVAVGDGQVAVTNRFVVRVLEANLAPVWTGPTQFVIDEGELLESRLLASDPDLPVQPLTYAVAAGPDGLGVSAEGLLRWRPTEAQGPSTNLVRVTVGDGVETVVRELTVVVREVNMAPVIAVADVTIEPLKPWTIRLPVSDADLPVQRLVVARVQGPPGLTVGEDGVVAWTPTAAQGATTNRVEVSVGDGVAVVTNAFRVVVARQSNTAPVIAGLPAQRVAETGNLSLALLASDADVPAQRLTFSLVSGPEGLTVSPSGALSFQPTEAQGPSTNRVMVRVRDDGIPALAATNAFTVIVTEVNTAPVVVPAGVRRVSEGNALGFTLVASDADVPMQRLTHALVSGPEGLTVSPSGAVSFRPTEAQGPGTNLVMVRVSDDGIPALAATNAFTVIVTEVNTAPVVVPAGVRRVSEGNALGFTLVARDADVPVQRLTHALVSGPDGLTVSPSGAVSFRPTEAQGPGTNLVMVRVSDDGMPSLSATNVFTMIVAEVNTAPALVNLVNRRIRELSPTSFRLTGRDTDLPAQRLTYRLVSGPAGLTVAEDGLVNWTPTEEQGPGTNTVTVRVSDEGRPSLSTTGSFTIFVTEANTAPTVINAFSRSILETVGLNFTLVGRDLDLPAQRLTYALVSGPRGMTVSEAGQLVWNPTEDQGPSTNPVVVRVSDDALTPLGVTTNFVVTVREANQAPVFVVSNLTVAAMGRLSVALRATDADIPVQALSHRLEIGPTGLTVSTNGLLEWTPGAALANSTNAVRVSVTDGVARVQANFRIVVGPVGSGAGSEARMAVATRIAMALGADGLPVLRILGPEGGVYRIETSDLSGSRWEALGTVPPVRTLGEEHPPVEILLPVDESRLFRRFRLTNRGGPHD